MFFKRLYSYLISFSLPDRKKLLQIGAVVLVLVNMILFYRFVVLFKSLHDPLLEDQSEHFQTTFVNLQNTLAEKSKEQAFVTGQYDGVINQVFPDQLSSDTIVTILNQIVHSVQDGIVLMSVNFEKDAVQKTEAYTVYPVKATFKLSRQNMESLLHLLAVSGTFTDISNATESSGRVFLPLIRVQQVVLQGDLARRYDSFGNEVRIAVPVTFAMEIYGKPVPK